jgi:hypothetical protein
VYDYLLWEAVGAFILFLQSEYHAANSNNQNTRKNHHFKKRDFIFQLKYLIFLFLIFFFFPFNATVLPVYPKKYYFFIIRTLTFYIVKEIFLSSYLFRLLWKLIFPIARFFWIDLTLRKSNCCLFLILAQGWMFLNCIRWLASWSSIEFYEQKFSKISGLKKTRLI